MSTSLDAEKGRLIRRAFQKFQSEEIETVDELTRCLYAQLTEEFTAEEIAKLPDDREAVETELAYQIFAAVASSDSIGFAQGELLLAMARALLGTDNDWRISLTSKRRGRPKSALGEAKLLERDRQIVAFLQKQSELGEKLEASVAVACAQFGLSRAQVFEAWSRKSSFEEWHERAQRVDPLWKQLGKLVFD